MWISSARHRVAAFTAATLVAGVITACSAVTTVLPASNDHTNEILPGVSYESIKVGAPDPAAHYTIEVATPAGSTDPDAPAQVIVTDALAATTVTQLQKAGLPARAEPVTAPLLQDSGGPLGTRVRLGSYATLDAAQPDLAAVKALGLSGTVVYTGWDGEGAVANPTGPITVHTLTIDPARFTGKLAMSVGPTLAQPEKPTQLATLTGAAAVVNAGFFVLDPAAGTSGDPAGVAVHAGKILREPVADRPALVIDTEHNTSRIQRLSWKGTVGPDGNDAAALPLTGVNRVPGKIRNCGQDAPAQQDITCTATDELIVFTPEYDATTPAGPGLEVQVSPDGIVTAVDETRGTQLGTGNTIQATGADVAPLRAIAHIGQRLDITMGLIGEDGSPLTLGSAVDVVNGGPRLLEGGVPKIEARRDGMDHADNHNFFYGWADKRNPRTFVGQDASGRTMIAVVDGRSTESVGLGLLEEAALARSLGMVDALNLDGGGSSAMVIKGKLVNKPSDAAGERPVGDALVVLPKK